MPLKPHPTDPDKMVYVSRQYDLPEYKPMHPEMRKMWEDHFDKCFRSGSPRTWVGLTDVEWINIVNKNKAWFGHRPDEVAHEVAKLVEAKLKEKNT